VVRALLEAGADVNKHATGGHGDTPLTWASYWGYVEVVRALLEAGADVNKRDGRGRSPLYCALTEHSKYQRQRKAQVAALLREAGAQEPTTAELEEIEELIAYIQLNMN
jgi:ankyrin repeat protein